jgi:hypothetical protein
MCKHVAATLYGIGVRLDEDPSLFFTLRKVQMTDLVAEAVEETTDMLLKKAKKKRKRSIADADIASVFGIVMEDTAAFDAPDLPKPKRPKRPVQPGRRPASGHRSLSAANGRKNKATDDKKRVLDLVARSKTGIAVPSLQKKTGLDTARIRNIVYTAFKKGAIDRVSRGVYAAVKKDAAPEKPTDAVLKIIAKAHMGIGVSGLVEESGFDEKKIRNILYRLNKLEKIKRKQRGVYVAAGKR